MTWAGPGLDGTGPRPGLDLDLIGPGLDWTGPDWTWTGPGLGLDLDLIGPGLDWTGPDWTWAGRDWTWASLDWIGSPAETDDSYTLWEHRKLKLTTVYHFGSLGG